MAGYPYLPLWVNAFLADTTHMDNRECGAYLLLLMVAWKSAASLPNEDKILARYARCSAKEWARVKPTIMPFWSTAPDGGLIQKRLEIERSYVLNRSQKASSAAAAKWLKDQQKRDADASAEQMRNKRPASALIPIPIDTLTSNLTEPAREPSPERKRSGSRAQRETVDQRMKAIAAAHRSKFAGNA